MEEYGPTASPQHAEASRGLFRRLDRHDEEPRMTAGEERIARTIDDRLSDGMQAIEEQATALMREVAGELWRAAGADTRPEQQRIVSLLSRDQAIRSLLTSNDERFQSLALGSARLEDSLAEIADSGRATRQAMDSSVKAIREIADSPTLHGVESVRSRMEQVEHHIAAAFQHLDQRDQALTEAVLGQIEAHGALMAEQTSRLAEAMQTYVQTGAEAMAILATRVEQQAEAFAVQDITISEHVGEMVASEIRPVAEQLELLSEKVGLHGRDQEQVRSAIERLLDARIMGLAQLIRSDSQALRSVIDERADGQGDALREAVDWRMAAFAEQMEERMERAAEAVATRASAAAESAITSSLGSASTLEERLRDHMDERLTAMARLIRADNEVVTQKLDARDREGAVDPELLRQTIRAIKELQAGMASDVQDTVDRRFQTMSDQLHRETQSTAESMIKVAEVLGEKIERLSVRVDEGYGNDLQVVIDRMSDAIRAMSTVRRTA
jgi:hypothetical protein